MQSGPTDSRLRALLQMARQMAAEGRDEEAARAWDQILTLDPTNAVALFRLGQLRFFRNDYPSARTLLEKAEQADKMNPLPPLTLSLVFRALSDVERQAAALDRALTADPYCYPALFLKGEMLERLGRPRQAARLYKRALQIAPDDGQLSDDMRSQAQHARNVVNADALEFRRFLDTRLAAAGGSIDLHQSARFDRSVDIAAGTKKVFTQKPAVFHYPELPAIQFYDNGLFPWLEGLEANTPAIREEFLNAYRDEKDEFAPYVEIEDGTPVNQWGALNRSSRWSALHFWRHGVAFKRVHELCPRTSEAVDAVPKIAIPGFTPTVLYSVLAPHTRIPPHTSSSNIRLIVHLPLVVPEGCGFRVGNETRHWKVGKAWVFDDTIEHEAWNDSDEFRAILMIDIWNPFLSPVEQELCTVLHGAMRSYYGQDTG